MAGSTISTTILQTVTLGSATYASPLTISSAGAVTALGWNNSGSHLAPGTADGFAAVVDFSRV